MDNESILNSVKKMLGLDTNYHDFDLDIIIHINSVISILLQMGVIKKSIFVSDETETWSLIIGDRDDMEMIKSYVYLKVKSSFDPPTGGAAEACNNLIKEYEWRLYSLTNFGEERQSNEVSD